MRVALDSRSSILPLDLREPWDCGFCEAIKIEGGDTVAHFSAGDPSFSHTAVRSGDPREPTDSDGELSSLKALVIKDDYQPIAHKRDRRE
jgi:hypothetical protein